jgi:hypothetical protein
MARIPEEEIQRLKQDISLERLAAVRGVELKPSGANLIGLCPFHDDHEPSLVIAPEKNLWHCLGACQSGGSVIDWIMKAEGVSFRHAVELLRADLPLSSTGPITKRSRVPKLPAPVEVTAKDQDLLQQVTTYYHTTLKASKGSPIRRLVSIGRATSSTLFVCSIAFFSDRNRGTSCSASEFSIMAVTVLHRGPHQSPTRVKALCGEQRNKGVRNLYSPLDLGARTLEPGQSFSVPGYEVNSGRISLASRSRDSSDLGNTT